MVRARMAVRRKARPRRRLFWAGVTVAPWCMASALLVSFTAEAGQEPVLGTTRLDLMTRPSAMPDDLVPSAGAEGPGFRLPPGTTLAPDVAAVDRAPVPPDEIEPRVVAKGAARSGPTIETGPRGDPAVAVRPTFDAGLRAPGSLAQYRAASLAFGEGDLDEPPGDFAAVPVDGPVPDTRLQPLPSNVTTRRSHSAISPQAAAGATTPHVQDGSTPSVARAASLASTTPAPAASTPIAVAALPKFSRGPNGLVMSDQTIVGIAPAHPDYAALIQTARTPAEQRCLAQAVYFEARSEPEEGQAAVAQVVLNRALSGLYPASVCGVVFQNQERHNACQFSFACEGHALRVTEGDAWTRAVRIAGEVTDGAAYVSDIGASTHYHATYVRPFWAKSLTRTDAIGHHVFYALKPGQT